VTKRTLAIVLISVVVMGCAGRGGRATAPSTLPRDRGPPAGACTVRLLESDAPTTEGERRARRVLVEYRFDARGRLLYIHEAGEHAVVTRSWFSYDARDRLAGVHREVEHDLGHGEPRCHGEPCPPRPRNDRDAIDEEYQYDTEDRLVRATTRTTHLDHQGGVWERAAHEPGSLCELDSSACPRAEILVGGTYRPYLVVVRTTDLRHDAGVREGPTRVRTVVAELRHPEGGGPWQVRPEDGETADYAYAVDGRAVTRFVVSEGGRTPDRRVERDAAGRVILETELAQGEPWRENVHVHDDAGRPIETVRTVRVRASTSREVISYAYDPSGRLTLERSGRDEGSRARASYEHGDGCTSLHRVPEDPRGTVVATDPLAPFRVPAAKRQRP